MKSALISEKIKCSHIGKHTLFRHLEKDHFEKVCAKAKLVKLRKNAPFLLNNEPASRVFFMASGMAKLVSFSGADENSVKDIMVDGELFGDFSFTGSGMDGYVTGLKQNTYMFYFDASDLKKILQHHHILSLNYSEAISIKLRRLEERHLVWTNRDARLRLLYFFQVWVSIEGIRSGHSVILENYLALSDIADFIGVSRQFMHKMLKELKEERLVYYSRKQIILTDIFLSQNLVRQKQVI
ncbi:MAG TPA: Crp/Fnr family transcriptional regulator [Ferruginibacter sp.]|nr:Crp/Fnr family transcriptional regulator [Ferruginibacter sp.]